MPEPPEAGTAYADRTLEANGVAVGETLQLGPARTQVKVVGWVDGLAYAGQGTLWASTDTWRTATAANRPDAVVGAEDFQALLVRAGSGVDATELARRIDRSTDGATDSLTLAAAIEAIPGVKEQRSTFNQIIGVTLVIAVVVVALFFALLTVERTALYGVLKAIGATSGRLFRGVLLQAVVVTAIAATVGAVIAVGLDLLIPPGSIPFTLEPARVVVECRLPPGRRRDRLCLLAPPGAAHRPGVRHRERPHDHDRQPCATPRLPCSSMECARPTRSGARRSSHSTTPRSPSTGGRSSRSSARPGRARRRCARSPAGCSAPPRARWSSAARTSRTYGSKQLSRFRQETVGFVFQAVNLVPFLTARENLLVVDEMGRRTGHAARDRADQLLEELGLADRAKNLPGQLSGGQRQRVAIGRALMNEPDLVLFDEPTSALDTKIGEQVMDLIQSEMNRRGTAAIIVTHDERITHYADRTVHITDGVLEA